MNTVSVGYARVSHLIAVGLMPLHGCKNLNVIPDEDTEYTVSFSDYVKSQLYLNLVSLFKANNVTHEFADRKILDFKKTYDFFTNNVLNKESFYQVLGYFLKDMFNFLIHNENNILLKLDIDCEPNLIPFANKRFPGISAALDELIDATEEGLDFDDLVHLVSKNPYSYILDYVNSIDDIKKKRDSLYGAILCHEWLQILEKESA